MKIIIKKYFTLLELLVTTVLLVVCFSFIGIKINKALYVHRSKNNLKKIENYFDFCKKMALANQADIYLKLYQKKGTIFCEIGTDETMGLFKKVKKIKDIFKNMCFLFDKKKIDMIEVIFSTTGKTFPNGKLEFFDMRNKFDLIEEI
jgi:hypothetical protein